MAGAGRGGAGGGAALLCGGAAPQRAARARLARPRRPVPRVWRPPPGRRLLSGKQFCHSSFVFVGSACVAGKGLATTPSFWLAPFCATAAGINSAALILHCLELEYPVEACKQQQHRPSAGVPIECFPADAWGCRNRARMACEDASRPDARLHIWIDVPTVICNRRRFGCGPTTLTRTRAWASASRSCGDGWRRRLASRRACVCAPAARCHSATSPASTTSRCGKLDLLHSSCSTAAQLLAPDNYWRPPTLWGVRPGKANAGALQPAKQALWQSVVAVTWR